MPLHCRYSTVTLQAYGALYLSLQLRRDGLVPAAVKAARPQLDALLRALADFMAWGQKGQRATPHGAASSPSPPSSSSSSSRSSAPRSPPPRSPSRSSARSQSSRSQSSRSPPASVPRGGGAAAALQTLELSTPSVQAVVCLALGLCPGPSAADSAAALKRAAELAAEAEDLGLAGICEHFSALARSFRI